jgi:mannose-6-phosphate isomerase-like protein (cupin superfamily)
MKSRILNTILGLAVATGFCFILQESDAAPKQEAKITTAQITDLHRIAQLREEQKVRPAQVKDTVEGNKILQTGSKSRAELEFNDASIARLGANTVFSFIPDTRKFKFEKGTMLFQVPKGRGTTHIATPAASCAVTGTTVQLFHVGSRAIYMVLEGTMDVTANGKTYKLKGGQALVLDAKSEPRINGVDVSMILETSNLIRGFERKLPSYDTIVDVSKTQEGYVFTPLDEVYDMTAGTDGKTRGPEIRRDIIDALIIPEETIVQPPDERFEPPIDGSFGNF